MTRHVAGVTLIETLVVLAILAMIAGMGVVGLVRAQQSVTLMQAGQQFSADVERARALSKRSGQPVVVRVTGPAAYLVGTQPKTLPQGTAFTTLTTQTLTFLPPFGVLDVDHGLALPTAYPLRHTSNASLSRSVRVISLFGKTVVR